MPFISDNIIDVSIILFNMQSELNHTFTSIPETSLIAVTGKSRRQDIIKCKICLEVPTPDKQLQSFCSCKEKYAYAHPTCLQSYVESKVNKSLEIDINSQQALICEKCEENYKIQCNITRKCSDFKKFKKSIERKSFLFGVCVIGIVLSIITLAVCSDLLKKNSYNTTTTMPTDEKQVVICFIIFSSLLFVFFVYKIIEKFLTYRVAKVET